jgi:hypothetical protein
MNASTTSYRDLGTGAAARRPERLRVSARGGWRRRGAVVAAAVAATLAGAVAAPPAAQAATFTPSVGIRPPINPLPCIPGVSCVPTKRALLVLMENGGFPLGLPERFAVDVPTCGGFTFAYSSEDTRPFLTILADYVSQVTQIVTKAAQCAVGIGWHTTTMDLTEYVNAVNHWELQVSDTVLEDIGRQTIESSRASEVYNRVEILEDDDFKVSKIRSTLAELAPEYRVDIHVLAHGSPTRIGPKLSDPAERLTDDAVANLGSIPGLHLRAVYQQNCFGRFMRDKWIAAGADVVNGSKHVNYMSFAYSSFLTRWLDGETFKNAVEHSIADWTPFYTEVFHHLDLYTHPSPTEALRRNPPEFSILGTLSASDELTSSKMLYSGSTGLKVTD